ncbi:MAG: hypothetical protein RIC80_10190 [Cyclobacteriaceae bacterium]
MGKVSWFLCLAFCSSCLDRPEFSFPEADQPEQKENIVPLIELEQFENDDHGWVFEISHPRSRLKFEGIRTTDEIGSNNHSLKIERLGHVAAASEGFYDFAEWRKTLTGVDIPRGAQIRLLSQIKLENVTGTGVSLIISLRWQGVQVGYSDSGWINGNGRIIEFGSFGTLYPDINEPVDEIEVILRMEPVTAGTIFFDDVELDLLY